MPSDHELVTSSLTGRKDAFALIVERYQGMVSGVLYSMCGDVARSEDLAQETFVAAWKGLGQLRDAGSLPAWLRGIARRTALNAHRKESRRPAEACLAPDVPQRPTDEPLEQMISREEQQVMWQALERVPEQYREPLVLYYRQQQSAAAVAVALGISEEALRQRLSRGRAMLRDEVAVTVERGLKASGPGGAFTLAVLAALPALGPGTALAGIGSALGKGSTAAKGLSVVGWVAVWAGGAIAIYAGIRGAIENVRGARSERERAFVKQWTARMGVFIIIFMTFYLLAALGMPYLANRGVMWLKNPNLYAAVQAVIWGAYFAIVLVMSLHARRRLREIQIEDGTYRGESQIRVTTPRQWLWGLTMGLFAALSWMAGMAMLAGDWASVAITIAFGVAMWGACARVLRGGLPYVRTAMMLMWAGVVAFDGAMLNVRVPQWMAVVQDRPVEAIRQHMPSLATNLLLGVIAVGVAAVFWISAAPLARGADEGERGGGAE